MVDPVVPLGRVVEGTTKTFTFEIADNGVGFQPEEIYLSIWDIGSGTTVMAETNLTPIANYVTSVGATTIRLTAANNALINTFLTKVAETHRIMCRWIWSSGTKSGKALFDLAVDPQTKTADA